MRHRRLVRFLRELQEELGKLPDSARRSGDPLGQLEADVEAALRRLEDSDPGGLDLGSLERRLREVQSRFVANHPDLAVAISSLLKALSGSGV